MRTSAIFVVIVSLALLVACGGGSNNSVTTPPPTLQSIAVTTSTPSVSVGVGAQFSATGTYSDGSTKDLTHSVTWSSSATSVATVNNGGVAQALNPGTASIKAASGSTNSSTSLTVTPVTLVSVTVTPGTPAISVGSTQQFTANANYSNNTSKNLDILVTWTSSNTAVAAIGPTGLVTALTTGTTTITATQGTTTATATLTVNPVPTATVFVSPTGSDSGTCTATAPCATPQRATAVVDGLTSNRNVSFTCGGSSACTYYLASPWILGAGDSGSSGNPVIYSAAAGNAVTISAGTRISLSPTQGTANLWQAPLPLSINSYSPLVIFYNGTRRFPPQVGATSTSPLGTYYRVAAQVTGCSSQNGNSNVCYDRFQYTAGDPLDSATSWTNYAPSNGTGGNIPCAGQSAGQIFQQGDIEILIFEKWTMSRQRIACVDTGSHTVYLTGTTNQDNNHGYIAGHRYLIENANQNGVANLAPGQFFVDRTTTTLYYMAQPGESPATDTVVIPTLQPGGTQVAPTGAVISAVGLHDVTFSGLTFSHDNYVPPTAGYASTQADGNIPAAVTCMSCYNVTFDSDVFTQTVGYGLGFYTDSTALNLLTGDIVQNSAFYDVGAGGLNFGNNPASADTNSNILQQAIINNNIVSGYGRAFPGSSGLEFRFGHDIAVTFNEVKDGYNTGIGVCIPSSKTNCGGAGTSGATASNITLQFNHVWNLGQGVTDDLGGIYTPTYLSQGNKIYNNKIHDVTDAQTQDTDGYGGRCVYVDSTTGNMDVENNLVYRCSANAFANSVPPAAAFNPNTVKNNIFAFSRPGFNLLESGNGLTVPTYLIATFTNNLYYFDRTANSSCGSSQNSHDCAFSFMQGCGPLTASPTVAQLYSANLYFNPTTDWSTAPSVMYTSEVNCSSPATYTFSQWQGLGQDTGSAVFDPAFVSPGCSLSDAVSCATTAGQDDYTLTGVAKGGTLTISSGNAFTAFDLTVPGRNNPVIIPPTVAPAWTTKPMDPSSDY